MRPASVKGVMGEEAGNVGWRKAGGVRKALNE